MEVKKVCLFCKHDENNELLYGKIYELDGEIVAHHFCLLLSSNMEQNGEDSEGIQGFLKEDILKEYKRGRRITCCYCKKSGATVGCCKSRCKKVFHLPCGRRKGSLHQFLEEFKSYCAAHRPLQTISPDVLMQVKDTIPTCAICRDEVDPEDSLSTLWAPCCKKNAWFHRDCVQQLALNFGYFFKCPLCNNKRVFRDTMSHFGIYVPEQDASWELEPHAFQDLLHRHNRCDAKLCVCPQGRSYQKAGTRWDLVLCRYCGAQGIHVGCGKLKWSNPEWECDSCTLMLQKAQEGNDTNSDEEPQPSPATVNQLPARRKRRYFKGSGGSLRTKCRKRSVCSSSSHPHPSSLSAVVSKDGPSAMTGGPVSPPTPTAVIEVSDDDDDDDGGGDDVDNDNDNDEEEVIEILDDDDDNGDLPGKTSVASDRMILSCDGKVIPVIQVATVAAADDRQNFSVVGDLDVKLPSHLYTVQQHAHPAAASNSRISRISGIISSVCGSSSSMSTHSSVPGTSSSMSVYSSAASSHSQPSVSGTTTGSLLKSYLTSENLQVGSAFPDQVPRVAQQMGNKTPAGRESQNRDTRSVQRSAQTTTSHNTAVLPSSRVCNRSDGDRYNQQHGSCIDTPSQQEPRRLGDRLTRHCVEETLGYFIATSSKKMQVEAVNHNIMTVYLPFTPVQKLFRNHVIETAPALRQDVTVHIIDCNILNPQVPHLRKPERSTTCSGQECGVGESYPEKCVDNSYSEKGVDDAYLERGVGDSCSEEGVDDAYLERSVGDSCSEKSVDNSCSEKGVDDPYLERDVGYSCSERGLLETDVGDTYSEGGLSEIQVGDSYSESGLIDTYSDMGIEDSRTESQFKCHLPVRSYSVVTRSRSRCVLNSNTHMTRSRTRKMQESRSPSCRCKYCRDNKEMLRKEDWKVHKDNNSSSSLVEMVRRRRSRSDSVSRNSREHHYSQNTFSHANIGVRSYSEWDSSSERTLSDTCSVMGLSDTYSEIRDNYSQVEGQYDRKLPVTSYSPIVTYNRSRSVLNSGTNPTRSLNNKMLDYNSSFSLGEDVTGRQSGNSSRGRQRRRRRGRRRRRRRRSKSLSLSRNTRKHHSNQNTFSPTEPSYSECDSNSERGLSDTCSVMGLSDTYSDAGVEDSQTESKFKCHLPVRSYSVVTRSTSSCVLNSTRYMTRSLTKKMQEGRFPFCRCKTCRKIKEVLRKGDWKVHKNHEVYLNRSVPRGVAYSRRRCRSVDNCGGTEGRRHSWGISTKMEQNNDRSVAFMNQFSDSMQAKNESDTEEIDYPNNGMYELNVIGNSQGGVVCNSGIGVGEVTGIVYRSSNIPQNHNSENMEKQICCIKMDTGVEGQLSVVV